MYRFWDLVTGPLLSAIEPSSVVEIGSDHGFHTRLLLEFCRERGGVVHVIDPLPKYEIEHWQEKYGDTLAFHKNLSLDALPDIQNPDVVLIDGDHNWYTVFNELKVIEANVGAGGEFPLVLLHDVAWPYGRRDLYYSPDSIPEEYRQPFERRGMEKGKSELRTEGGVNRGFFNATHEGGKRNGVLTAVEDFVEQSGVRFEILVLPVVHGLGLLVPKALIENNEAVAAIVRSFGETQNGASASADLMGLAEDERVRVVNEFAEGRLQAAGKLAAQKREYERRIRQEEIRVQKLLNWMLLLNEDFSQVLSSRQWKAGGVIKDAYGKVTRKPEGPSAARDMTEIFEEFADWRERNEIKRKPDLAHNEPNNARKTGTGDAKPRR